MTKPDEQHAGARPAGRWRDALLAVPVLALTSVGCAIANLVLSEQYMDDTTCTYLAVPWTLFAVAYGAVASAGLALYVHVRLFRTARHRGWDPTSVWDGWLSTVCAAVAVCALLLGAVEIVLTHAEAMEVSGKVGQNFCVGMSLPG